MLTKMVNGVVVQMTPEEEAEFLASQPGISIPAEVTRAQALIALSRIGITKTTIQTALANSNLTDQQKLEGQIWFDESLTFHRNAPTLGVFASLLGLSSSQVDDLFLSAASIHP